VDDDAVVNFVPLKSEPDPSVVVVVVVGPASWSTGGDAADELPAGAPVAGGGAEPPHAAAQAAETATNARRGVMKKRITHSYHAR
jgi:hypothetical protein